MEKRIAMQDKEVWAKERAVMYEECDTYDDYLKIKRIIEEPKWLSEIESKDRDSKLLMQYIRELRTMLEEISQVSISTYGCPGGVGDGCVCTKCRIIELLNSECSPEIEG